ncbi:hypothetical protein CDV50_10735 [Haematobacter massiliensis]|uniref:Uncharacterized protein n=1 Tax=Haematobacter massiliensis TaxID=195105 RepID=A0A086Y549_9RHOB|nr:helix-turn-helix domain-containing protein [Haematobacter massiliensis]KFI29399.1 hypothetical protein CN97_17215 [Haematobacter massiliensis]OWJ71207.1 hypothetical protein CDV50_10735 [Haematobacter massiliensis]OWJ84254.1 hypothetical protein CDV51_14035 [Haematobacter massiliensis]QBJ26017.1 hypothetical protein HmaOT1_16975 [Haematobacter massiliensis]
MNASRQYPPAEEEDHPPPGPYDGEPSEGDLWFLPPDPEEEDPALPPWHRRPVRSAVEPALWEAAQAALSYDLATLTYDRGRLDERARHMGDGARERLAAAEALALGWGTGDRVGADRLALWRAFRIGAPGDTAEALARTAWAARRLSAPPGRGLTEHLGPDPRLDTLPEEVEAELAGIAALHPVVKGCAAYHLWQGLDERPWPLRRAEAAVIGARIAAEGQGTSLAFLPLALAGPSALVANGPVERRLARWVEAAHQSVLVALLTLDRLMDWRARATEAIADLSGRTPPRLLDTFLRHPMVSVPLAARETGSSRAAAQRNIDTFAQRGLVREVTGHARFRVWALADQG